MHSTLNPSRFGARRKSCVALAGALLSSMGAHAQTQAGRLRAIAVTSAARSRSLPDIPTVAERGFPGFQAGSWMGMFAPKGTPEAVIATLNQAVNEIIATRAMQAQMVREAQTRSAAHPPCWGSSRKKSSKNGARWCASRGRRLSSFRQALSRTRHARAARRAAERRKRHRKCQFKCLVISLSKALYCHSTNSVRSAISIPSLRLVRLAPDPLGLYIRAGRLDQNDLRTTLGPYAKKRRDSSFARHPVTRIARGSKR